MVGRLAADDADVKRGVRADYDLAAQRYRERIAPTFVPIARRVLWYARPNSDDVHVDVATGTGLIPAVADDRRMMTCIPPWRAAMDFSGSMLRQARDAARSTRLVQGDLDRLPFRTGSLDLVTLSLALHHLPSPRFALPELRRVLCPRGRAIIAAWSHERSLVWRAFDDWFERAGLGTVRSDHNPDLRIDTPDRLRAALLEVGGFETAEVTQECPLIEFASVDAFWEWRISFPATYRALIGLDDAHRECLRLDCLRVLEPYVTGGPVRADQPILFAVARP